MNYHYEELLHCRPSRELQKPYNIIKYITHTSTLYEIIIPSSVNFLNDIEFRIFVHKCQVNYFHQVISDGDH